LLAYFVLKVKKSKPRKKDLGKPNEHTYDSGSMSTILKQIFSYFRSFDIPYLLCEFNKNGGFTAVIEQQWDEIIANDPTFGVGYYAAYYDQNGDQKMREPSIVEQVFNDYILFQSMVAMQSNRNCAFRGQDEPTSLQWAFVRWGVEDDPNSIFFLEKTISYEKLKRKNGQITVANPRREKNQYVMKIHANKNDPYDFVVLMTTYRGMCHPDQIHVFCQPMPAGELYEGKYYYNPNKRTSKKQYSDMIRKIAQFSDFDNYERCTGHAPRKHVHDLMAYHKVPLGKS